MIKSVTLIFLPLLLILGHLNALQARELVLVSSSETRLLEGQSAILTYTLFTKTPNLVVDVVKGRSYWSVGGEILPTGRQVIDRRVYFNGQQYFSRNIARVKVTIDQHGQWMVSPVKIFVEKLSTAHLFDNNLPSMKTLLNNIGKTHRYELDVLPVRFVVTPETEPASIQPDKILSGEDIDVLFERERKREADRRTTAVTLAVLFGISISGGAVVRKLMKYHNPAVRYFGETARFLMSGVNKDTRYIPRRDSESLIGVFHELYASPHHHELDGFIDGNQEKVLERVEQFLSNSAIRSVFLVNYRQSAPPVKQMVWADPPQYAKALIEDIRKGTYSYILTEKDDHFLYIWLLSQDVYNDFCRDKYFLEKLYAKEITSSTQDPDSFETIIIDKNGNMVFKSGSKKPKSSEQKTRF
jgi:hypothetical protein